MLRTRNAFYWPEQSQCVPAKVIPRKLSRTDGRQLETALHSCPSLSLSLSLFQFQLSIVSSSPNSTDLIVASRIAKPQAEREGSRPTPSWESCWDWQRGLASSNFSDDMGLGLARAAPTIDPSCFSPSVFASLLLEPSRYLSRSAKSDSLGPRRLSEHR